MGKSKLLKKLVPIITVWLFAIYPVLALYAHNAEELVLQQATLPLGFSLIFSTILFGLWGIILKNNYKASLVTIILLLIFWYYALIYRGITQFNTFKHWHLIPLLFLMYFIFVYFIAKARRQKVLKKLNTILLAPITLLIVFNVITILPIEFKKIETLRNNGKTNITASEINAAKDHPDIYLIVLDEYASFKSINEEWDYTNSEFEEFLREKGFYVAEDSETRFNKTKKALTSLMNLKYIDESYTELELNQRYHNNHIFDLFDKMGYGVVFLDGRGIAGQTAISENILHVYYTGIDSTNSPVINEFSDLVFKQSMLKPLLKYLRDENTNLYYNLNNYIFNYISNFPSIVNENEQPTFLYAYIMCPHLPYVFDRKGNFTENPTNYWEYKSLDKDLLKKLYLEQYIHVTTRMTDIINEILETSENEPIIILLSDHGPRGNSGMKNSNQAFRVMNAIYFPDRNYHNLYSNIAPVNTLRALLNKYFGGNFKMLEDR